MLEPRTFIVSATSFKTITFETSLLQLFFARTVTLRVLDGVIDLFTLSFSAMLAVNLHFMK